MLKKSKPWNTFIQMPESSVIIGIIIVLIILAIFTRGQWFSSFIIAKVLRTTAFIGIIAIGQAVLVIGGELDISVGSVYGFTGLVYIWLAGGLRREVYDHIETGPNLGPLPAFLIVMIIGLAIGFFHAILVTKAKIPSLIVTLGSMFIFRGIIYLITQGFALTIVEDLRNMLTIRILGNGGIGEFTITVLWLIIITVIFAIILPFTRFGNRLQAVGKDPITALSQGISPHKTKIVAFLICSSLVSFTGILGAGYYGAIQPSAGEGMEFESILAAVLGGCVIGGGIGSIWGTVLGAFLLASVWNGLIMMGVPIYWYVTFVGIAFILIMMSKKYVGRKI